MSRSRKKTPITTFAVVRKSQKKDKKLCNRRFRAITRKSMYYEEDPPYRLREVQDEWTFDGDGKGYWKDCPEEEFRK